LFDRERFEFGSRFIVVPNPMYGDWENAIYGYKSNLTDAEREADRRAALKVFPISLDHDQAFSLSD
jgi:predicted secreted acid phosphatase